MKFFVPFAIFASFVVNVGVNAAPLKVPHDPNRRRPVRGYLKMLRISGGRSESGFSRPCSKFLSQFFAHGRP